MARNQDGTYFVAAQFCLRSIPWRGLCLAKALVVAAKGGDVGWYISAGFHFGLLSTWQKEEKWTTTQYDQEIPGRWVQPGNFSFSSATKFLLQIRGRQHCFQGMERKSKANEGATKGNMSGEAEVLGIMNSPHWLTKLALSQLPR